MRTDKVILASSIFGKGLCLSWTLMAFMSPKFRLKKFPVFRNLTFLSILNYSFDQVGTTFRWNIHEDLYFRIKDQKPNEFNKNIWEKSVIGKYR